MALFSSSRFYPRHKWTHFRRTLRKWKPEVLLLLVRQKVLLHSTGVFTAEQFASDLKASVDSIRQAFHKLNLEGIMSQKIDRPPHDSKRDRYTSAVADSSWQASLYRRREKP